MTDAATPGLDGVPPPRGVLRWLPGVELARHYQRRWLNDDLVAGLVLTALLVPQGMAYAELAGLPPVTGLYTTVMALLGYALFGPSRILVLGPDSSLAPMIFAAVVPLAQADGDPQRAVALASALALLMGAISVVAGLTGLGALTELLSKPVRIGYLNGLAFIVFVSQLPKLFGFSTDAAGFWAEVRAFAEGVAHGLTEPAALAIGVASILVILAFRRWLPTVPGVLVAVVGATVVAATTGLAERISVVGEIPGGFPTPALPLVGLDDLAVLVPAALGIALVTLADTSALSRSFAARRGDEVDPDQEVVAVGAANLAAGFFQGFPVSASSSRTAVAESVGARSQLTGVVGAAAVTGLLLFATGLLTDLPSATLAAVVITASFTLLDVPAVVWFWRVRRSELLLSLAATVGVLAFGVLPGIVIAILLSLANFVRRAWRPYTAVLGRLPDRAGYHDIERHPDAVQIPGVVIFRFDAPLFFANAESFRDGVASALRRAPWEARVLVVAAEPMTDVDTTGAEVLEGILDDLDVLDVSLWFAELKGPVKDRLHRYGLYDRIGEDQFFETIGAAMHAYRDRTGLTWDDAESF